mmetsp:Transcript_6161/g.15041  ORF Transcript_6161/g.15041 Transcript_6161/m.15041 type:complete len:429 (-) Transcript_6161:47-1333(-)
MPDPFQTTTGRDPEPPIILRWFPHVYQQQKETAAALSLLCTILALCLLFYCLDSQEVKHDTQWAGLPWLKTTCAIKDIGVAYRGTCSFDTSLVTGTENVDFQECLGPPDTNGNSQDRLAVQREWLRTSAGQCAEMGDADYRTSSARKPPSSRGSDGGDGMDMTSETVAAGGGGLDLGMDRLRRLRVISPRTPSRGCSSSYVPWAVVSVRNATVPARMSPLRCAYRFGAVMPSITGDFGQVSRSLDDLRSSWMSKQEVPCWKLAFDDCIIAFDEISSLVDAERAGGLLASRLCGGFGFLAVGLAVLAAVLHWMDTGACWCIPWGFSSAGYQHCAIPPWDQADEEDFGGRGALSDRVMGIVRGAAARLGEATPPSSGASTLRTSIPGSRRTIEISGGGNTAPKNLAAEFLYGGTGNGSDAGGGGNGGKWW